MLDGTVIIVVNPFSDEGGTYSNTRQIFDELGVDDYKFGDILIVRETCMVVSRRSANLAAAGSFGPLMPICQPHSLFSNLVRGAAYWQTVDNCRH
jgi:hypothetical protein